MHSCSVLMALLVPADFGYMLPLSSCWRWQTLSKTSHICCQKHKVWIVTQAVELWESHTENNRLLPNMHSSCYASRVTRTGLNACQCPRPVFRWKHSHFVSWSPSHGLCSKCSLFFFSLHIDEITNSFRRYGHLVVDWPHKAESKSYFPPKGKNGNKSPKSNIHQSFLY